MANFYDEWLGYWDAEQEERAKARKVIHEEDLEWVRTKQDYRAALICSRKIGFVTDGDATIAEIPPGWRTGRHSHGEEAIFIVEGEGFSIIDGKRYDWDKGSCVFIPFGVVHQHFNRGTQKVRYASFMALALERFAGLARIMQFEEAEELAMNEPAGVESAASDIHPEFGRIVMRLKDAFVVDGTEMSSYFASRKDAFALSMPKEAKIPGAAGHRSRLVQFMDTPQNDFHATEVEISGVIYDKAGMHSGKHAHMEALLYVLEGQGYGMVDGEKIPFRKGTLYHIQGPQTVHQHFFTTDTQQIRIHYGTRAKFFQPIAKGVFPYKYYEYGPYKEKQV